MKTTKHFIVVLVGLLVFAACQKEFSLESGMGGIARGALQKDSATNDCQPIRVSGTFYADSTLADTNYVLVNVNVTTIGNYRIVTNTENNFSFRDSGYFSTTGVQAVKLTAVGRPTLATTSFFLVQFDSSVCSFSVTTLPNPGGGTGGGGGGSGGTSAYTFAGAPNNCATPTINGTYTAGTPLNPSTNTVTINVNVATAGTYTITTPTSNGMTFSGNGTFPATGPQTILLRGNGIPVISGTTPVPINANGSSCTFNVPVNPGSGTGGGPTAADSAWSFNQGSTFFYGPVDGIDTSIQQGQTYLVVDGITYPGGDSSFQLIMLMPNNTVQSGTFTTATSGAFFYYDNTAAPTTPDIYSALPTTSPNAVITIQMTYNSTTRLVTGTFSGNAVNAAGATVPITNGKFRGVWQ